MNDVYKFIIIVILAMVAGKSGLMDGATNWLRSRGMPEKVIIILAYFFFMVWTSAPWIIVILTTCAVAYAALATKVDK